MSESWEPLRYSNQVVTDRRSQDSPQSRYLASDFTIPFRSGATSAGHHPDSPVGQFGKDTPAPLLAFNNSHDSRQGRLHRQG
jgi:hypothetical protein